MTRQERLERLKYYRDMYKELLLIEKEVNDAERRPARKGS
jgi:hypothetical protein